MEILTRAVTRRVALPPLAPLAPGSVTRRGKARASHATSTTLRTSSRGSISFIYRLTVTFLLVHVISNCYVNLVTSVEYMAM